MDSLAKTAAAEATFEAANGRKYSLKPITIADLAAFEQHVRTKKLTMCLKGAKAAEVDTVIDPEVFRSQIESAVSMSIDDRRGGKLVSAGFSIDDFMDDIMERLSSGGGLNMAMSILSAPISETEMNQESETLDGAQFMLYRALRHNPGITEDSMGDIVTAENIAEINIILTSLGASGENPPSEEIKEKETGAP